MFGIRNPLARVVLSGKVDADEGREILVKTSPVAATRCASRSAAYFCFVCELEVLETAAAIFLRLPSQLVGPWRFPTLPPTPKAGPRPPACSDPRRVQFSRLPHIAFRCGPVSGCQRNFTGMLEEPSVADAERQGSVDLLECFLVLAIHVLSPGVAV